MNVAGNSRRLTYICAALWILCSLHNTGAGKGTLEHAYVGPGAGFAFIGSFLTIVLSLLASVLSFLIWPFRILWLAVTRKGRFGKAQVKKIIFLGLDGLDPKLTERWMAEGKLPNLSRLRQEGIYRRLRTTCPPLSPVAWSTFATGVNPAKHNIFDFLNRDLRNYAPELSSARVRPATRFWQIGKWRIPLSRPSVELRRKSEPFWKILGRNAIGSTILRVPITFPPERFNGRLLSAMSTPDLRGTQGSFSWFSTAAEPGATEGGLRLPLRRHGAGVEGRLPGPDQSQLEFRLRRTTPDDWELDIDGQTCRLKSGEYTPWLRLRFAAGPLRKVRGIARFLLTVTDPEIALYATPIELDPENPALPISHPGYYAAYLAKLLGTYATLGMAEDTWALNEGAIDEEAFLNQAKSIQAEREGMFFNALERTRRGVVACVFDTTDRVQHMFYRQLDAAGHQAEDAPYAGVIEDLYRDMDRIVGNTFRHVDEQTAFFVLSDHGFCSFQRGVNLNSWLRDNGYLALLEERSESGDYFEGIDWDRTRAYTFGLSGIYLNLQGREAHGIVPKNEAAALKAELIAKLTGLPDPRTGDVSILNVYDSATVYKGPYLQAAPDLLPGFAPGYRTSWSAAVGKTAASVFEDNHKAWSGDHCVDPAAVPGVLFANRKLAAHDPGIEDMAPTVLDLFGLPIPKWMDGRALSPVLE